MLNCAFELNVTTLPLTPLPLMINLEANAFTNCYSLLYSSLRLPEESRMNPTSATAWQVDLASKKEWLKFITDIRYRKIISCRLLSLCATNY